MSIDLLDRAHMRAVMLGFTTITAALKKGGVTHNDVRRLKAALRGGRPSYRIIQQMNGLLQISPENSGYWFSQDDEFIRTTASHLNATTAAA